MSNTSENHQVERESVAVPLQAEQVVVSRQIVEGDTVRVATVTQEHEHNVDEILFQENVEVTHVPVGREVAIAPEITRDGDLTIIPIVEEVLVVTRKLFLKEEIHLRRVRTTARHQETVVLRKQQAMVTREAPLPNDPNLNPITNQGD